MATELVNGMVVQIPVTLVAVKDFGNVRCLAGTRVILLDGPFLAEAGQVLAGPPALAPDSMTALAEIVHAQAQALARLQAQLEALEAPRE